MKAGAGNVTGNAFTAIQLGQPASDLLMDGILALPEQILVVMEHLDRPLDEFFDAAVSAAFDILLDQLFQFGLQVYGHTGTLIDGPGTVNFMVAKNSGLRRFEEEIGNDHPFAAKHRLVPGRYRDDVDPVTLGVPDQLDET